MEQIERAAIAMVGEDLWAEMSEVMKDQYREQARRALAVLQGGKQVPWNEVAVTLSVVLTENSGSLTTRRADSTTRERIVREQVERMKQSGYTVLGRVPYQGWGILGQGAKQQEPPK